MTRNPPSPAAPVTRVRKLTNSAIAEAKPLDKPYKLTDSGGLYVDVRPTGKKIWRYRFRVAGRETIYTLGEFEKRVLGLDEARTLRNKARELVRQGKNPTAADRAVELRKQYENSQTFAAVLDEWLRTRDWGEATRRNREAQIDLHVRPHLGALPVREITTAIVLEVLRRAEVPGTVTKSSGRGARTRPTGGPGVARRLRQYIAAVMDLAVNTERADRNPAGRLRGALTKAKRTVHKTALNATQIGKVLRAIDAYQGGLPRLTSIAFRLLWWSAARPGEVTGAQWSEIDLDAGIWTIPAERMKMGEAHRVPLARQAVECLKGLHAMSGGTGAAFPHRDRRDQSMTRDALTKAVTRMNLGFEYSPHATRTTASAILNEIGYRGDVIERQLAHQETNAVRRAYNRTDYLDERREMMQAWADKLDAWKAGATVVSIQRAARNAPQAAAGGDGRGVGASCG